ncbi:cytochrome P450 [Microthyrium microscopicum]|uniref:Cytochrome P450 n=1 Tax=Microthyrium microscopicum TaxID=703497 RepID=A0A6A6UL44_9PEZI|nr:cytochrome P450 [Microthyrium microscopicum]
MGVIESAGALGSRISNLTVIVALALVTYQLSIYVYNIFFHPLRKFPGPLLSAASCLPLCRKNLSGDQQFWITELHAKYGEVVRYSPNELSFSSGDAWKDIYGHRKAGQPILKKNPKFYLAPVANEHERVFNIIDSDNVNHTRIRRIFSNAFSDRALKLQEQLFLKYVDKLVSNLLRDTKADPNAKFNMVNQYNFTTFDVMSDLCFSEPLNLLENTEYHSWVAAMFANFRYGIYLFTIRYYQVVEKSLLALIPRLNPGMAEKQKLHHQFTQARVDKRMEIKEKRPDIWGLVLEKDEELGMTRKEMYANAQLFMIAGTETTATLLSGLTYYLLAHPDKMKLLADEIRGAFPSTDDISIEKLQSLKYLHACIEEGLRMYPPVSNGLPRVVPEGGVMVDDTFVPPGASISLTQYSCYRNPKNFKDPYDFVPERWLADNTEYATDKKHALQPFSYGPRNCLGKNMAYHEMRLILAKLLYNFDIKLCEESSQWIDQKIYIMWDKPELKCQLVPIRSHRTS